jgi:hypothetical protein
MQELIKQAFLHVDVIGPLVAEGHYDLIGPNGEIILPQVWETMIEPDWSITMHMWPIPEKPPPPPSGVPFERPRSHGRHPRPPVPPMHHRGPPGGWPPGVPPPRPGPSGSGPGPAVVPQIIPVGPAKPSRRKPDPSKGVLGWMVGKPSKPSGKGTWFECGQTGILTLTERRSKKS